MNMIILLGLVASLNAFANLGEGAKSGCNQAEWTCDSACQHRKAVACGLAVSSDRTAGAYEARTPSGKKGAKGRKNATSK